MVCACCIIINYYYYKYKSIHHACAPEDSLGAFGDGAQGHGLLDLGQRQHHGEAGQRGQPGIPHVVAGEVVVGLAA